VYAAEFMNTFLVRNHLIWFSKLFSILSLEKLVLSLEKLAGKKLESFLAPKLFRQGFRFLNIF
jgi:hypothetical protein